MVELKREEIEVIGAVFMNDKLLLPTAWASHIVGIQNWVKAQLGKSEEPAPE